MNPNPNPPGRSCIIVGRNDQLKHAETNQGQTDIHLTYCLGGDMMKNVKMAAILDIGTEGF